MMRTEAIASHASNVAAPIYDSWLLGLSGKEGFEMKTKVVVVILVAIAGDPFDF
jgi:hypothetical protein